MLRYPLWLRHAIQTTGAVHDIAIIVGAWLAYYDTPLTLSIALGDYRIVWCGLLATGGLLGLAGLLCNSIRLEWAGCSATTAAKLTWAVAAFQPLSGVIGTDTLACLLIAGAATTMWRFFGLMVGYYLAPGED